MLLGHLFVKTLRCDGFEVVCRNPLFVKSLISAPYSTFRAPKLMLDSALLYLSKHKLEKD